MCVNQSLTMRRQETQDMERARRWLIGLLLFNGVGAVFGGVGLLTGWLGAPLSMLDGTPFSDYTIPAWLLLVPVGCSSLGAAYFLFQRSRYAGVAAMFAGAVLLGWIVIEFVMIPEGWAPQLAYFLIGLAIVWLGRNIHQHPQPQRGPE